MTDRMTANQRPGAELPIPSRGALYLDVHYLRRLSDGGPDHPAHVAAVCRNCHRRCHHAADAIAYSGAVSRHVCDREAALGFLLS